jgi:hypothetical protein
MILGKAILGIVILSLLDGCRAQATKPAVQVVFEFAESGYRRQLGGQAPIVEGGARDKLLRDLNDQLPFLRFRTDPQDVVLRVRLGSPSAGSEMHTVNFQISAEGKDPVTNKPIHSPVLIWPYRSATAYDSPLGSVVALITDLGLRFAQGDHDLLVSRVLRGIALSHEGVLVQSNPPIWVIPFTQNDLCMDFPSYLEIDDEYHTDTGDRSGQFRVQADGLYSAIDPASPVKLQHKIEGIPADPPPDQSHSLQDLETSAKDQNKVTGVYVVRYNRRSPSCNDIVQPPTFRQAGGSQ